MSAFTRHRRLTMPLTGYRSHWSLYVMAIGLGFILTVIGAINL
jgi:hypothetical protein